jgi:hypothetical protein
MPVNEIPRYLRPEGGKLVEWRSEISVGQERELDSRLRAPCSGRFERAGLKKKKSAGGLWRIPGLAALLFAPLLFSSQLCLAQFKQQGPKLVGTAATELAQQGSSVSLSSDGNTAIVGGPYDNTVAGFPVHYTGPSAGAAWVFTRSGGVWTQQGNKLVGMGATAVADQGSSVSLSADGNTAIVGGPDDNAVPGPAPAGQLHAGTGAAWVFTRSGGVWTQQGSKLVGTGASGFARQGSSVSLSADGNTAIVGGPGDNNNSGAAWVFTRWHNTWSQQGSKLVGTGASGFARQGSSVSLSADGNTAIVGGWADNNNTGAAWVFTRSAGVWTQQGSKLVGTGASGAAFQGHSVSLSADGNTAIVGGWADNNNTGAAWVFTRWHNTWSQQGSKLVGTGASGAAAQGHSVSLSADGNTAIVGGPEDDPVPVPVIPGPGHAAGAAWVFTRSGGVWTQQGSKLVGTGASGAAHQGSSVSLSGNGNTVIVGGPRDDTPISGTSADDTPLGAAWVYNRAGEAQNQAQGEAPGQPHWGWAQDAPQGEAPGCILPCLVFYTRPPPPDKPSPYEQEVVVRDGQIQGVRFEGDKVKEVFVPPGSFVTFYPYEDKAPDIKLTETTQAVGFLGVEGALKPPRKAPIIIGLVLRKSSELVGVVFSPTRLVKAEEKGRIEESPVGRTKLPTAKPHLEVITGQAGENAAAPGETFQLAGRDHPADGTVEIAIDDKTVKKVAVGQDGGFSASVEAPQEFGFHTITIIDQAGNLVDGAMLAVRPEGKPPG